MQNKYYEYNEDRYDLNLPRFIEITFHNLGKIFFVAFCLLSIWLIYFLSAEKNYVSSVTLDFQKIPLSLTGDESNTPDLSFVDHKNIFQFITQEDLFSKAITESSRQYSNDTKIRSLDSLRGSLEVTFNRLDQVTDISFSDPDPIFSKTFLDNLILLSQKKELSERKQRVSQLIENIDVQMQNIIDLINTSQENAKLDNSITQRPEGYYSGEVSAAMIQDLNQQLNKLSIKEIELQQFYKPQHPVYSTIIVQKEALLEQIASLQDNIFLSNLDIYKTQEAVNQSILTDLSTKKLELLLSLDQENSFIRLTNASDEPSVKGVRLITIFLPFLGILGFIVILILRYEFQETILNPLDLSEKMDINFMGEIPNVGNKKSNLLNIEENVRVEALNSIFYKLLKLKEPNKPLLISLASLSSGDGKSEISYKLYETLRKKGYKVAIVDCDFRKKGLTELIGLRKVDHIKDLDRYLSEPFDEDNGFFVPGINSNDPVGITLEPDFKIMINKLRDFASDFIIFDNSPLGTFSDAKGLIDLVDMHICVLSYNSSSKKDIVEIINKLEGCDLSTIYFVLNRFSIFRTIYGLNLYYPGYKYSQYYNYYK